MTLPLNRQLKKLSEISLAINDGNYGASYPKSNELLNSGIPFLTAKNIGEEGLIKYYNLKFISHEKHSILKKAQITLGDIILVNRGAKNGLSNIASIISDPLFIDANISPQLTRIRVKGEIINNKYLYYYFYSNDFKNIFNNLTNGAALTFINLTTTKNFEIPLPALPTQEAIVAKLDEASAQITDASDQIRGQLQALDELRASTLAEVFENKEWEKKHLSEISHKIQYGYTGKTITNGKYRYLRITDIQKHEVNWDEVPFVKVEDKEAEKYLLNDGDVVFARTGATVGKSFLINDVGTDKIFASYLIRVVPNYKFLQPEFLKYFFQSDMYRNQIYADVVGAAQPNFNGKKLGELLLPLPDLATQTSIVTHLDHVSQEISLLRSQYTRQLQNYDDLRASILDRAFKGELVE